MSNFFLFSVCLTLLLWQQCDAFGVERISSSHVHNIAIPHRTSTTRQSQQQRMDVWQLGATTNDDADVVSKSNVEEYKNIATKVLSNFMSKEEEVKEDPFKDIDFNAPKISKVSLDTLAQMLDAELYNKEWFVTGNVNPIYFADEFEFQDPDVKLTGIEDYARGVYKLFNQETSRAEIISTVPSTTKPNTITVTWRLSGSVDVGPGLTIKPYICYTDLIVDEESGLILFQEDRFDIPGWDILLSAAFPFLIGKVTAPEAPPVSPRPNPPKLPSLNDTTTPKSPLDKLMDFFN